MTASSDKKRRSAGITPLLPEIVTVPYKSFSLILLAGLAALGAWSVFSRIEQTVPAQGFLLRGNKYLIVTPSYRGRLLKWLIEEGQPISKGQQLAQFDVSDIKIQEEMAKALLYYSSSSTRIVATNTPEQLQQSISAIKLALASTEKNINNLKNSIAAQQEQYTKLQELVEEGAISKYSLLQFQQTLDEGLAQLSQLQVSRQQLVTQIYSLNSSLKTALNSQVQDEIEKKANFDTIRKQLNETKYIYSSLNGFVEDLNAAPGQVLEAGTAIATLSQTNKEMTAVLLLPTRYGRQLQVGETAYISPANAPPDRFGYIRGKVGSISTFTANENNLLAAVGDPTLADQLLNVMKGEPAVIVRCSLNRTPAGELDWTSSNGPAFAIPFNTLTNARLVVEQRPPIDLVLPELRRFFGLES